MSEQTEPEQIVGTVCEIGNNADGDSRILIYVDYNDLKQLKRNLLYKTVCVTLKEP